MNNILVTKNSINVQLETKIIALEEVGEEIGDNFIQIRLYIIKFTNQIANVKPKRNKKHRKMD